MQAMASSPPPPPDGEGAGAGAVCCMCGDHGVPGELVRCRRCRVRLQHRYCSDLYPRAAAYRRCNWCLREPADQGGRAAHAAAAGANNKPEEKRKAASASASASDEERQRQRQNGCSLRRSPAEPGHPVKKKHKADEKMPPPPPPAASPDKRITTGTTSDSKEVMRAGKTRVNRVKVQRYKLLAEIISC